MVNQTLGDMRVGRLWLYSIGLGVLIVLALMAVQHTSGQVVDETAAVGASISGRVTLGSSGVSDAKVIAIRSGVSRSVTTNSSGDYTISGLLGGSYELNIEPASISTSSPSWVYTGTQLVVSVPSNTSVTGKDFTVQPATVTVTGVLTSPDQTTPFTTPNRAWVRAENQEGQGNTVQTTSDGHFTIKALSGVIKLNITLENPDWSAPAQARSLIYTADPQTTIAVQPNPLQVLAKGFTISGTVMIKNDGSAPANIPVIAWRIDGSDYEEALTNSSGGYSMDVISGTWLISPVPLEGQSYVTAEAPKLVTITDTSKTQNLLIANADVTLTGRAVLNGAPITDTAADGRAYALYTDSNGLPILGSSTAVNDGSFTMKLASSVAVTYTIGMYFPPDAGYTALSRVVVSIPTSNTIDIPAARNNSTITGTLFQDGTTTPAIGIPGSVFSASNGGGWARTRISTSDATYRLNVATSDTSGNGGSYWNVLAFADPTSGYFVRRPRVQQVFLPYNNGNGGSATANFTVVALSSFGTISGTVTAPAGLQSAAADQPLAGVRVEVQELGGGSTALSRWTYTDRNGKYRVQVPPGSYRISIHVRSFGLPFPLIPPSPVITTLSSRGGQTINLQYRRADSPIVGQVMYKGTGHVALIRAISDNGASVALRTGSDGRFQARLLSGVRWRLQAVSSEGNDFLRSNTFVVTPTTTPQNIQGALVLTKTERIPERQLFRFDSQADQVFEMGNGSSVQIPGGSLVLSGTVALTVQPLPELASDGGAQPISFGYRLQAFDRGRAITHFLRPITLVIPFTAEQLNALGITMEQLRPSYWDEASTSWKPVETVSVIPDSHGGGTVNILIEHFTDFAILGEQQNRVVLPLIQR